MSSPALRGLFSISIASMLLVFVLAAPALSFLAAKTLIEVWVHTNFHLTLTPTKPLLGRQERASTALATWRSALSSLTPSKLSPWMSFSASSTSSMPTKALWWEIIYILGFWCQTRWAGKQTLDWPTASTQCWGKKNCEKLVEYCEELVETPNKFSGTVSAAQLMAWPGSVMFAEVIKTFVHMLLLPTHSTQHLRITQRTLSEAGFVWVSA